MNVRRLNEIATFASGGTPSRSVSAYFDGDIPWITGADIGERNVITPRNYITAEAVAKSAVAVVPAGTLLLVTRTSVGKVAVANSSLGFSQDITAIRPDTSLVDRDYLASFLVAHAPRLALQARGATIKGVTRSAVGGILIPLPPLADQRRIAEILNKADQLRVMRRHVVALHDELASATFEHYFGDVLLNRRGWESGKVLGDVANVVSGITKGRRTSGLTREVPYLTVANVQDKSLKLDVVKRIEATEVEIERYRLHDGDLLLTEGGDPDKLGRGTVWRSELRECIHQNHVFRVRVTDARIIPTYLAWLLGSALGKSYFLRAAKQTTGIASINSSQLRRFPILCPPRDLQEKFAADLASVDRLRGSAAEHVRRLDELFASLQQRAFSGQL
jgi:type I restriction enzyme S subunit